MRKRIVIALGGNAILSGDASADAQQKMVAKTAEKIVPLIKAGHELVISHGNGPQVGNLLLQQISADSKKNPALPLDTLVAMTQGSIGYWMEKAIDQELAMRGVVKDITSIITQAIVDKNDPAFKNPTKPIGPFLSEEEAKQAAKTDGATYKEDSGRGWRRVVPSPIPIDIKEASIIKKMLSADIVVIAAGGGGIPVIKDNNSLIGVEAVIDKDLVAEKLAELIDADLFVILTGVDNVYVNYNKPNQKCLERVTTSELKQYIKEDQFPAGSMLPKVEAAIAFAESGNNRETIITSIEKLDSVTGDAGTIIVCS